VSSPYQPGGAPQISKDGRTAYALVNFTAQANNLSTADITNVIATAKAASNPALDVEITGQATDAAEQPKLSGTLIAGIAGDRRVRPQPRRRGRPGRLRRPVRPRPLPHATPGPRQLVAARTARPAPAAPVR
jgi:hypothetical protein